jgi:hypothetical protein
MIDPFRPLDHSIPVRAANGRPQSDEILIRLAPQHRHQPGTSCPSCDAQADLRAKLFDLLLEIRAGNRALPSTILIDAPEGKSTIDQALIPGRNPLRSLRDRTVLRSFHPG